MCGDGVLECAVVVWSWQWQYSGVRGAVCSVKLTVAVWRCWGRCLQHSVRCA